MKRTWRVVLGFLLLILAAVMLYWGFRPPQYQVVWQPLPVVFP